MNNPTQMLPVGIEHLNWFPPGTLLKPVPSSRFCEYTDHVTGS